MNVDNKYCLRLVLFFTTIVLWSCGKDSSCFKNTGKIIIEQRFITNEVNTIEMEDKIDLVITQSNDVSLKVEGGENLLPYINTDVSGTELKISSDNRCSFFRDYEIPITVYLSVPNIKKLKYTGQGTVTNTGTLNLPEFAFETHKGTGSINLNMNADNISIFQHTGPSDVTISGTAKEVYLFSGENGWLFFNDLYAEKAHVNHGGTGDIFVRASQTLLVELTSIGNVNYYGDPTLTVTVHSGSGDIIKK